MSKPRRDGPGRVFHITARVNWRAWHLESADAKGVLCKLITSAASEFCIRMFAHVEMSNHLHMVLQSPAEAEFRRLTSRRTPCRHLRPWPKGHQHSSVIAQFMRRVRSAMSRWWRAQLDLTGRFWEGAYDARGVEGPRSLAIRIAYDHRNPVVQGMAQTPDDYYWSSAAQWASGQAGPIPLDLDGVLPFGLDFDSLRAEVLHYQRSPAMKDRQEDLQGLLWGVESGERQVLAALLDWGVEWPQRGTRAAVD